MRRSHTFWPGSLRTSDPYLWIQSLCTQIGSMPSITLPPQGARTLTAYARDESPLTKIGRRTVTVAITKLQRAAEDAFEIRWEERVLETGAPVKTERFMATISIVLSSASMPRLISKNPLGLYVDRFTWWRDSIGDASR